MKVYKLPQGLEAPEPDYSNYDAEKEQAAEAAHQAQVKDWLLKHGYPGKDTGRIYREGVADGHAIYMFADNGAKSALIHLPYGDAWQSRSVSGMSRTAILKLMKANDNLDGFFVRAEQAKQGFWASRKVGEILHYHNSFGQFIRGEVVDNGGKMELKPTALCGNWNKYDLPYRSKDGTINYSYHVKKIQEGESWQPSDSCVYEAPAYSESYKSAGDPRVMPAINLELPPMSDEEIRRSNREILLQKVVEMTSHENRKRDDDDSLEVLQKMANLLNAYLNIQ